MPVDILNYHGLCEYILPSEKTGSCLPTPTTTSDYFTTGQGGGNTVPPSLQIPSNVHYEPSGFDYTKAQFALLRVVAKLSHFHISGESHRKRSGSSRQGAGVECAVDPPPLPPPQAPSDTLTRASLSPYRAAQVTLYTMTIRRLHVER